MNGLAVCGFLVGLITFITLLVAPEGTQQLKAENTALEFVLYRNAVNKYALAHKNPGTIAVNLLDLPYGKNVTAWRNLVVYEDGELRCYVYGAASVDQINAARAYLRHSYAVGWNDRGFLQGLGAALKLPQEIPTGALVSVINIH